MRHVAIMHLRSSDCTQFCVLSTTLHAMSTLHCSADNLEEEMDNMRKLVGKYRYVAMVRVDAVASAVS